MLNVFKGRPAWGTQPISSSGQNASSQQPRSGTSSVAGTQRSLAGRGVSFGGKVGSGGKGLGKGIGFKRHRKIARDTIRGITNGDIRRLARRGGIKRLQGTIYGDMRTAMQERLKMILKDCCAYVEHRGAKTVQVNDVIFALQRLGRPIYGFGSS